MAKAKIEYGKLMSSEVAPAGFKQQIPAAEYKDMFDEMTPGTYRLFPGDIEQKLSFARSKHGQRGEFSLIFSDDKKTVMLRCNKRSGTQPRTYK